MEQRENLGGTMNSVERIGMTIRRIDKGGSALHEYLKYLEDRGMPGVPRFLGMDEQGREMLSYLPGKTQQHDHLLHHPCLHSDETLIEMAKILRRLHDLSEDFLPRANELRWSNPLHPQQEKQTICHNDAATWNFTFVDDLPAGLFDFDTACPGSRAWDLTLPVFSGLPLLPYGYDPERDDAERKRRIRLFFDAYGMRCPDDFFALVHQRMVDFCHESTGEGLAHYERSSAHILERSKHWNPND